MKKTMLALFILFLMGYTSSLMAQKAVITNAKVNTIMVDNVSFGGCMALLDKALTPLNCPSSWVSFSCTGPFSPKDIAFRQLDLAEMAMSLNKPVHVLVDDSKKHNGQCFAQRIYMLQ